MLCSFNHSSSPPAHSGMGSCCLLNSAKPTIVFDPRLLSLEQEGCLQPRVLVAKSAAQPLHLPKPQPKSQPQPGPGPVARPQSISLAQQVSLAQQISLAQPIARRAARGPLGRRRFEEQGASRDGGTRALGEFLPGGSALLCDLAFLQLSGFLYGSAFVRSGVVSVEALPALEKRECLVHARRAVGRSSAATGQEGCQPCVEL